MYIQMVHDMNMCQGYYSMCSNISDVKCCVHVHLYSMLNDEAEFNKLQYMTV